VDILEHLVHLASMEVPPREMLRAAAREIAADLRASSCLIFLSKHTGGLILRASFGEVDDEERSAAAAKLANEAAASVSLAAVETPDASWLAVPLLSRAHGLGAIVVGRNAPATAFSNDEAARLSAIAPQLIELVEGASLIEVIDGIPDEAPEVAEIPEEERILQGTAASPGIAVGAVAFRHAFPKELVRHAGSRGEIFELESSRDAFEKTRNDLLRMQSAAASELGEDQALVFGAHLLLLHDSTLLARIEHGIRSGRSAIVAVDDAFEEAGQRLRHASDPYIQEKIEDVEDLRSRILGHLLEPQATASLQSHIVVSPRTSPSVIMELKAQGALGVASELGGATSHGALLARALGVPAVTGVANLLQQVRNGDALIIDGSSGKVIVRPAPETVADYVGRATAELRERSEFSKFRDRPARTADGVHFKLQANVALGVDLDVAHENAAEGVGLYRTEFAFIAREGIPSLDEQVRVYAKAYRAFPDGPISFRILDLAGDKFLASAGIGVARSPFHGYRSIRVLFDYPHILRTQVQAFALAAGERPLRILVPMVSSLEELQRVKELVLAALADLRGNPARSVPSFGAMIEVPAAVEIITDLSTEADFFSIGTNDLIQYALVADREDPRLSSPRNAFHPAILRMIRRVVDDAHRAGREVSVCGEAAARPEVAIALLALGVDALSVTPRAIPELKRALAGVRLKPLVENIDEFVATPTSTAIEESLRRMLTAAT
jgi:phosphoenolpyruvate-protein phosphotransferase